MEIFLILDVRKDTIQFKRDKSAQAYFFKYCNQDQKVLIVSKSPYDCLRRFPIFNVSEELSIYNDGGDGLMLDTKLHQIDFKQDTVDGLNIALLQIISRAFNIHYEDVVCYLLGMFRPVSDSWHTDDIFSSEIDIF